MADLEKDLEELEELEEDQIVVMTDEEGNEYYYREEMLIPVGEKHFAILVPVEMDEEHDCAEEHCDCCNEDECTEADVYIARIDTDENGEEVYLDPTDEEFEQVRQAYEELMFDDEEE